MEPTWLAGHEIATMLSVMSTLRDGPWSDTRARMQRIIDRHSEVILCGSRFPFSGFQGTCDRPINHRIDSHRWTRSGDGWTVIWDDRK